MPSPFLFVVVWLSLWSAYQVASDDVTMSGAVMTNGKQETTASQLSSDSVTSESTAVPSSSNVGLDLGTLTMVEGTTATKSSLETTDTIEFRVLAGLSCKWVDGNGVERQPRVCPLQSTCDLGPITIVKKSGRDQRLYFCTGEQNLLVSIACRLEDKDRVIVLPRCVTGSRCSIGPLALSYRGRQVQGYFCDARMLSSSSSSDRTERGGGRGAGAADTWTASGRSRLDRQREQGPERSSDRPTFNRDGDKDWKQDGKDHASKDGKNHDGDNDGDHVHHGPQGKEGEWQTATTTTVVVEDTSTADTLDRKRVPGTTA